MKKISWIAALIVFALAGRPSPLRPGPKNPAVHPAEDFRILLVAISVKDLDSSVGWYQKYLGFALADKRSFPGDRVSLALLRRGTARIELVRHDQSVAPSTLVPNLDNPALIQGYGKVAYEVTDIENIVSLMKADGVKFVLDLRDSTTKDFMGYRYCIVIDNSGNWVQLYQNKGSS
jgi:catechol 2,3-dioxygenase-like lactoylglutathione lyase family enzyme